MDEAFPPWQTAHVVFLLNVLIISNCLFYHCLSKWREMGCQEHAPVVIQTACSASRSAYFSSPWTEIYSSPAIFAKCFLAKQNDSANKNKEESVTRKTSVSQPYFCTLLFLWGWQWGVLLTCLIPSYELHPPILVHPTYPDFLQRNEPANSLQFP